MANAFRKPSGGYRRSENLPQPHALWISALEFRAHSRQLLSAPTRCPRWMPLCIFPSGRREHETKQHKNFSIGGESLPGALTASLLSACSSRSRSFLLQPSRIDTLFLVYSCHAPPGCPARYQQKAPGALWESRLGGSPLQRGSPWLGPWPAALLTWTWFLLLLAAFPSLPHHPLLKGGPGRNRNDLPVRALSSRETPFETVPTSPQKALGQEAWGRELRSSAEGSRDSRGTRTRCAL